MSEPWFDPNTFGGILGATFGILGGGVYGPLVGSCAPKGKLKGFVLGYHFTLLAVSVGLAAVGGYAYFVGQPNGIWGAFVLVGLIGGPLFGFMTPVLLKRYRDAELAQEQPQDEVRVMSKQQHGAVWTGGGLFVIGLTFTIIGLGGNTTFLIIGIVFLASSGTGLVVARSKSSGWKLPETTGPPAQLRAITSADVPISKSASWQGDVLEVRSDKAATQKLFDVELSQVEQCKLAYRFLIQTDDLRSSVYPEMWCRIPKKGEFFSRGVQNKIKGTNEWIQVEIPFYLQKGQLANLLNLNLVFEGEGTVRLKDIEVTSAPVG